MTNEAAIAENVRLVEEKLGDTASISEVAGAARAVAAEDAAAAGDGAAGPAGTRALDPSLVIAAQRVASRRTDETDPEVQAMIQMHAKLLRGNPREIKRFLNLFRFYANIQIGRELSDMPSPSLQHVGKMAALAVRWPNLVSKLVAAGPAGDTVVQTLERLARANGEVATWRTEVAGAGFADGIAELITLDDLHELLRRDPPVAEYAREFM